MAFTGWILKHQRNPKKALKVTVTFSGSDEPIICRSRVKVPFVDVSAVRARTGMSQDEFAVSIGVPVGTVTNWEQGRRQPTGAAKVLLALLAKKPSLVADLYPAPRPQPRWAPGGPDPSKMTAEERLSEVGQILAVGILRMRKNPPDNG
ncbi:helix-turn-helix domain-containing protein [Novosphingobium sp. PASSN1]|uniref:helix-turn-helix domain-containing protein n=1 Tax=Novosphingobium sp. PASSN1 TaxID=2015561 RepID=UPI0025DD7459|nr:helix-turn-helix domain-containing protein [Novosphingobium sp. PASSN1]